MDIIIVILQLFSLVKCLVTLNTIENLHLSCKVHSYFIQSSRLSVEQKSTTTESHTIKSGTTQSLLKKVKREA